MKTRWPWWAKQNDDVKAEAFTDEDRHPLTMFKELYKFCMTGKYIWAQGAFLIL